MTSIDHLGKEEQKHFILCDCGHYIDMRDLGSVFDHLHAGPVGEVKWSHSRKIGEPAAYPKKGPRIDLN